MPINKLAKDKIISIITTLMPDAKIYLYGSHARGTAHERSDIDIALDTGSRIPINALGEIKNVLEGLSIPHTIDVVDIHAISVELFQEIVRDKVLWKA